MTATTHIFDKQVHEANEWIKDIEDNMGVNDPRTAYHALRGVLFALRDRIHVNEAFDFSSQLPNLIRGMYFEGYKPKGKPDEYMTNDEFLKRVENEMNEAPDFDTSKAVACVMKTLRGRMSEGQIQHVMDNLPKDLTVSA